MNAFILFLSSLFIFISCASTPNDRQPANANLGDKLGLQGLTIILTINSDLKLIGPKNKNNYAGTQLSLLQNGISYENVDRWSDGKKIEKQGFKKDMPFCELAYGTKREDFATPHKNTDRTIPAGTVLKLDQHSIQPSYRAGGEITVHYVGYMNILLIPRKDVGVTEIPDGYIASLSCRGPNLTFQNLKDAFGNADIATIIRE